ncbi:hypothetical protein [Candidatus Berkiella aquae]|uniref:Antibiotic biosynthesis monooxygenase n=1 Tax=Candidatus Berkiella aquae TaxID=295108 RepID=A0A0Q9YZI2_9GAMM|nr:hypothetical protein [Candidatus Berkiella aquae]MCS5712401.1 hypothetical protein [Candidatus Berkiella aquae]
MFAVIYQGYLRPNQEENYQRAWQIVASYFKEHRGALGSCLHKTKNDLWVAYSRWPDKATRDASWPGEDAPASELPENVKQAIKTIQSCLDPKRKIAEIAMDVVNDLL